VLPCFEQEEKNKTRKKDQEGHKGKPSLPFVDSTGTLPTYETTTKSKHLFSSTHSFQGPPNKEYSSLLKTPDQSAKIQYP